MPESVDYADQKPWYYNDPTTSNPTTNIDPNSVGYATAYIGLWAKSGAALDKIAVVMNEMGKDDIMSEQPAAPDHSSLMDAMKEARWPRWNDPFEQWTQIPIAKS